MSAFVLRRPALVIVLVAGALAGCAGQMQPVREGIDDTGRRVDAGLISFDERATERAGGTQVSDGIFMAAAVQRTSQAGELPARVQGASSVSLISRDPLTLSEISDRLTDITGISHVSALGPAGRPETSGRRETIRELGNTSEDLDLSRPTTSPTANEPAQSGRAQREGEARAESLAIRPRLRGPLSAVLNELAAAFEVEWTYEDGRIVFRDYVTRQYQLSTLPSSVSVSSSIAGVSSSAAFNIWSEIETAIEGLAGEESSISVGQSTGIVTATARISDHERIRDYVSKMNAVLGQQIAFDINVITVTLDRANSVGVNLQAALSKVDQSITWAGGQRLSETSGSVNMGITRGSFSLNAIIDALASQGQVAIDTRTGGTTTNNRVVPVEVVEENAYVAETEALRNDSGDITGITQKVETVTTGFTLNLLPRVLNTREIMVEYNLKISDLNRFRDFGNGEGAIQLPETSSTSFQQQAILQNGQTLVLAGFERRRLASMRRGTGRPEVIVLGGENSVTLERVAQVITITPRLLSRRTAVR